MASLSPISDAASFTLIVPGSTCQRLLPLVSGGLTNKEIARALALSPRTVETHRAHLSEKLQAESLAQLIRRYGTLVDEAARP